MISTINKSIKDSTFFQKNNSKIFQFKNTKQIDHTYEKETNINYPYEKETNINHLYEKETNINDQYENETNNSESSIESDVTINTHTHSFTYLDKYNNPL